MLDSTIAVFLDDILLYSQMVKEYFTFLEKVLAHLCQYLFYYKLKKYGFLPNSTILLGFYVTPK